MAAAGTPLVETVGGRPRPPLPLFVRADQSDIYKLNDLSS